MLFTQTFGSGPDLVFLHGFLGSGDNFWPHAQALQDRYRCWLFDLPGHGRSPHLPHYSMSSMAESVFASLQGLGLGSVRMVGHSLGGKVTARLAQLHPQALERVVLADITPAPTPPMHGAILHAMRTLPLDKLQRREDAEPYLRDAEPVMDVRRFLLKNLAPKEGGGWSWKPDIAGFERDEAQMLQEPLLGPPYPGKALLIKGAQSKYVNEADVAVARQVFPNLELQIMDAGHWLHAEKPAEFIGRIAAFLEA
jgi:esterase